MIHLKHSEHGYHIAYTDVEARLCEKNGWKKCDIAKEFEEARQAKEGAQKAAGEEKSEEVAKRGRPRKDS